MTSLAWLLSVCPAASLRNGNEAVTLAARANRLCDGKQPGPLMALGAAYAEVGRFPEAATAAGQALTLVAAEAQPAVAGVLRAQITLYQAGKPCRIVPGK
jgi:hypothetical protein